MLSGASPENRFDTETPSSARSPRPLLARSSMTAASAGTVGDQHATELAVVPPERGHVVAGAVQDALLAGRRGAGQLHGPLLEPVAAGGHPAGQGRHRAGLECPLGDGVGDSVHLHEHDAFDLGVGDGLGPGAEPAQRDREGVVGPGGRHPGQQGADRGGDPGRRDQGPERVRRDSGQEEQRDVHRDRLPRDREGRDGQPPDRTGHDDEDRTDEDAEDRGERRGDDQVQRDEELRPGSKAAAAISASELIAQASTIRPRSDGRSRKDMRSVWPCARRSVSPTMGDSNPSPDRRVGPKVTQAIWPVADLRGTLRQALPTAQTSSSDRGDSP